MFPFHCVHDTVAVFRLFVAVIRRVDRRVYIDVEMRAIRVEIDALCVRLYRPIPNDRDRS